MKKVLLLVSVIVCVSCSPKVIHEVYTQVVYRDRVVHDTATVEIPHYIEKNVTKDTTSHLENPYAKSDAVVSGGLLWHSLETKPQQIEVPVEVHVTDTLIVEKEAQIVEKKVEVEKPLPWWKQAKIDLFPWLLLACLALICYVFRKPLINLCRKLVLK